MIMSHLACVLQNVLKMFTVSPDTSRETTPLTDYFVLNAEVHDYKLDLVLIYMFLVLEVLLNKGLLDIKEVWYGIDYLLD